MWTQFYSSHFKALSHEQHRTLIPAGKETPIWVTHFTPVLCLMTVSWSWLGVCVEQEIDALKGLAVHEMSYRQWWEQAKVPKQSSDRMKGITVLMGGQMGNLSRNIETIGKHAFRSKNFLDDLTAITADCVAKQCAWYLRCIACIWLTVLSVYNRVCLM